jgi:DNA modification methylase
VLRKHIRDESVDLCYIDPPFNSKRNYNQIYNNVGKEDLAQAQAFVDTWTWDKLAVQGFSEIISNENELFNSQTINLILGFEKVLGMGNLLAYLVSITLRVVEIHRVLKSTGSFYLHCDPTASHYLKLVLDSVFCPNGGDFKNEIIWHYSGWNARLKEAFSKRHDVIFLYSKHRDQTFNSYALPWDSPEDYARLRKQKVRIDENGERYVLSDAGGGKRVKRYLHEAMAYGKPVDDVWNIDKINNSSKERLGYPTQKPETLLERILLASSNEGDVVLDAYCGCGSTVAVAQKLNRQWIGIDITYQSISLIIKRLEDSYGSIVAKQIKLNGIPKDLNSAIALANKEDDRTRKEFEKWAILTYSNNRAVINLKKGADKGIDGTFFFHNDIDGGIGRLIFQVKSGNVSSRDIRDLYGTITREDATLGVFITLKKPTADMQQEANRCGFYRHPWTGQDIQKIQIVTIADIIEKQQRIAVPVAIAVLKSADRKNASTQLSVPSEALQDVCDLRVVGE